MREDRDYINLNSWKVLMKHCLDFIYEKEVFKSEILTINMKSGLFQGEKKIMYQPHDTVIKNNI